MVFAWQNGTTIAQIMMQHIRCLQHQSTCRRCGGVEEPGHGYREVEPEDLHRFRGRQLDGDLRRACAQFCEEPPFGLHRAGSGSRGHQRGSVAVYPFRPDGIGDAVSEVHALRRYNEHDFAWLPGLAGGPFLFRTARNAKLQAWKARGMLTIGANRAGSLASHTLGTTDGDTQ